MAPSQPRLPPLLRAALLLCLGAFLPWPLEGVLATAALAVLVSPRCVGPVVLLLLGLASGRAGEGPLRTEWSGWVRARGDTRSQRREGVTFVELAAGTTAGGAASAAQAFLTDDHDRRLAEGQWAAVTGTLTPARPSRNPGGPDEPAHLRATPATTAALPLPFALRLRRAGDRLADGIELRLRSALSPSAAALARSLALGRSGALAPELRQQLKQCGAWHLFAVSGSHVVLIAALLARVMPRRPERLRQLAIVVAVFVFALLSGGQAPAWRAAISHALTTIATLRTRRPCTASLLAAAFLLLMAIDASLWFDAGTQLSFAAVFALLVAARHGPSRSPRGSGRGIALQRPLAAALRCSLFAAIATAPLTALHFGTIAWWAPLSTLLLAPLVTLALLLSLVTCAATPLPSAWLLPCDAALRGCAHAIRGLAEPLAQLPSPPLAIATPDPWVLALLFASWLALFARRARLGVLFAVMALAAQGATDAGRRPRAAAALAAAPAVAFDRGHGQAVLLRTAGRCDLIDAGGRSEDAAELVTALAALAVERLDALVLSHLDADHCGAAARLLDRVAVGELVVHADAAAELAAPAGTVLVALARAIARHGIAVRVVAAGARIGPHEVVWPPPGRRFAARNDGSLALLARCGRRTLLVPGDLEGYPLIELACSLASRSPIDALLLPHHGNADPGLPTLLEHSRTTRAFASRSTLQLPSTTEQALQDRLIPWRSTADDGALPLAGPR